MRPSSAPRPRLARAASRPCFAALLCLAALGLSACQGSDQPKAKKLDKLAPFDRGQQREAPDPDDPLRNPAYEVPRAREGEQVPEEEIDALLAEAKKLGEQGNVPQQRATLHKCANKIPASARCDGEYGLTMADARNRRAAAIYFLTAAAGVDDPKADAELYRRIGEALRKHGRFEDATAALELAVARDDSAENLFALARVLSLQPDLIREAAAKMAEARAKDDRLDWHYEEAVLRGQLPIREEALAGAALFESYLERLAEDPESSTKVNSKQIQARIIELKAAAKKYPTAAEWEKQRAEAGKADAAKDEADAGQDEVGEAPDPDNDDPENENEADAGKDAAAPVPAL